jgi:hypothetical protein
MLIPQMTFSLLRISIPFIWFGAVCSISFMEAPLKFQAPNITTELGLGIGRLVFYALNKVEVVLALVLLVSFIYVRPKRDLTFALTAIVFAILFLQSVWLLPLLDARAALLLNGEPLPPSHLHIVYIAADAIKAVLLLVVGFLGLSGTVREGK